MRNLIPPFCLISLFSVATVGLARGAELHLLIKDARVVDGTGSPWFVSDVAINDGRIITVALPDSDHPFPRADCWPVDRTRLARRTERAKRP